MAFFTSNPLGRILNRFSADLGQVHTPRIRPYFPPRFFFAVAVCSGFVSNRLGFSVSSQGCPIWISAAALEILKLMGNSRLLQVDEDLPNSLFETLQLSSMAVGAIVVVAIAIPWIIILVPFLIALLVIIRRWVRQRWRRVLLRHRLCGAFKLCCHLPSIRHLHTHPSFHRYITLGNPMHRKWLWPTSFLMHRGACIRISARLTILRPPTRSAFPFL